MGSLAKLLLLGAFVLVLLGLVRFAMMGSESRNSTGDLVRDSGNGESLAPCPDRPNCVSSQAEDEAHRVDALPLAGEPGETLAAARQAIEQMPGGRVVEVTDRYLHAEFTSRLFRFVDDLELLVDPQTGVLHVRSASRVGYSDLGANRKRVDTLRNLLGA